ncbi:hypothetical protein [Fodinibius sediminis]|uniref:AhpC/TSA family protein n=1 Tax=Fodinibius sediminis TaxID=1214077 RepID=A0A521EXY2_9BACT|nr:hypothetical protein [Fodinibius sediminis]SMO88696.1 hypothetical protein SAMN06265218_12019 [Fodinibius sediminis]
MLIASIPAISQTTVNSDSTIHHIPNSTLKTVKGEQIKVGKKQHQPTVIFLLSKPSSMSKGKLFLKYIRLWVETINSKYKGCVSSFLIVQPFKTSFPFYHIQKGKLKNESFPVILDKDGKILDEFGIGVKNELSVIITKGNQEKLLSISVGQNKNYKKEIIKNLDKLILKSVEDTTCKDS